MRARNPARATRAWEQHGLEHGNYVLVTLHRPSNVDDRRNLGNLLEMFGDLSERIPIVFPIHPRTRKMISEFGLKHEYPGLKLVDPIGYLEFLAMQEGARLVLTDSGGIQEETTILRVPCLTLRTNTERPVTTTIGTSRLVGNDPTRIRAAFEEVIRGEWPEGSEVPLWDGRAAERVAEAIAGWLGASDVGL